MASPAQIHYDGEWPAVERTVVESAVAAVEAGTLPYKVGPEAPWILIRRKLSGEYVYLASFVQTENIVTGRSAEALAGGIRRLL